MALNGKYVKIPTIIEGLYRDYGWTHEVDWVNVIEWLGEFMDLVAAPDQYIDKVTDGNKEIGNPCAIEIKNYRGKLPDDILYIVQAQEYQRKIPMRKTTDNFHIGREVAEEHLPDATPKPPFSSTLHVKDMLLKDGCAEELTYSVSQCYMFTNFKEGLVEIAYKAFPTDEEGMPMIPDNTKYVLAAKAYVAEKIGQRLWMQGKMTGDKFQYLQRERDWYMGAATSAGNMPDVDKMESWKNAFVRLVPNLNFHDNAFRYMGDPSQQINHNSRR
jgi:hypothetical protein